MCCNKLTQNSSEFIMLPNCEAKTVDYYFLSRCNCAQYLAQWPCWSTTISAFKSRVDTCAVSRSNTNTYHYHYYIYFVEIHAKYVSFSLKWNCRNDRNESNKFIPKNIFLSWFNIVQTLDAHTHHVNT